MNGNGDKALCLADQTVDVPEHPWFVPPYVNKSQTYIKCPYGSVGDRLWVRETCWSDACNVYYTADNSFRSFSIENPINEERLLKLHHYAGGVCDKVPSIHMPRWASRITLEITGVRVERLNDISEADAQAEGVGVDGVGNPGGPVRVHQRAFQILWKTINGPGSWSANPWVWVIEFKPRSGD